MADHVGDLAGLVIVPMGRAVAVLMDVDVKRSPHLTLKFVNSFEPNIQTKTNQHTKSIILNSEDNLIIPSIFGKIRGCLRVHENEWSI